jgi:hypothetical protein
MNWKFWQRKPAPQPQIKTPGRIWNIWEHNFWGNRIEWQNIENLQLVGWTQPIPETRDEFRSKMQSGKIGRFVLVRVRRTSDVADMWFGYAEFIGYL